MLTTPEKLLFLVLAGIALWSAFTGFRRVVGVVARGDRALTIPRWDHLPRRAGSALVRTLGQVTVFPGRPWVSLFHAFVFYGFVFYLLVNVVDVANGLLPRSWTAAFEFGLVGDLFRLFADLFGVLVLVGVAWLLVRRFVVRDPRLSPGSERVRLHERVALIIYACGVAWLAQLAPDLSTAIAWGVTPFLVGDALKVALAPALLPLATRALRRR